METFVIYAYWEMPSEVDEALLAKVDEAWDQADESFCSGADRDDHRVLSLSFNISAANADAAGTDARQAVEAMANRLGLPGQLRALKGYTMEGWFDYLAE